MRKRPLFCAACMCTLGAFAGSVEWRGISLILLVAATLFLFLGTYALNSEWKQAFGRGIVFLLLFVLFFQHASSEVEFREVYWDKLTDGTPVTVRGTLYKKEQKNDQYLYYLTGCTTAFSSGSIRTNDVAAYLKSDDYSIGQILTIDAKLNTWKPAENEGGFDARAYYLSQKIDFSIKSCRIRAASGKKSRYKEWLLHIKNRMGAVYEKCLDEVDAGVLKAMILGDKTGLDSDIRELYKKSGISHILAISGVKTLKLDIPLVPETRINWAFVPLHIAIIYILKLCLDEEIIPRCRFPCSRGYFKKCINWQNKKSFSVSQSYRKSLKNQQKEKKPMAYKKYREMKVYEASGYQYKRTPSIVLKGQWLSELGFDIGDQIEVKCEDGRLIITKANEIWQCE